MPETTCWRCDKCGELIQEAEHGWIEWLSRGPMEEPPRGRGLRLVHHAEFSPIYDSGGCQYRPGVDFNVRGGEVIADGDLECYLGDDGLTRLLSLLARQEVPTEEILEMIKRLHTPGYELARLHVREAIAEGVLEPNLPDGYYYQCQIENIIDFVNNRQ